MTIARFNSDGFGNPQKRMKAETLALGVVVNMVNLPPSASGCHKPAIANNGSPGWMTGP